MKSATTASTEIPQPAIAMPVCPVGTNSDATPRRRASRSSSSATVIFPIAQSEPTVRTIFAGTSRFSPVGTLRSGRRLAQVAELDAVLACERDELGVARQELVQPVLDVEAVRDARADLLAQRGREAAARVATPTSAVVGLKPSASSTEPTTGKPCSVSPARSVSSSATTFSGA